MKIAIVGICGVVGGYVYESAKKQNIDVVFGVDINESDKFSCPIYKDFDKVTEKVDAIIDFSYHGAVKNILEYAVKTSTPVVLATTGYNDEELKLIEDATKKIAIFRSGNMSLGVNLLLKLVKEGAKALGLESDIEIVEMHHNRKLDAPSGTALMIADAIKSERGELKEKFGRCGQDKRKPEDLTIHSLRGGTVVGVHEVVFAMDNEVITVKHTAENRKIFADGAINAAKFILSKQAGLYNMQDMMD